MKKLVLLLLIFINMLFFLDVNAQETRVSQPQFRKYATQTVLQRIIKESPETQKQMSEIEKIISSEQRKLNPKKISIPIVFHILHSEKEATIDEEQIYAQIEALNRDFDREKEIKHPADTKEGFSELSRKLGISFCLPKKGPLDNKKGEAITFQSSPQASWDINDAMKSTRSGGVDPWDTDSYLNVWVVDLKDGWSGYAQMPGGPSATDGIVIDADFFGLGKKRNPAKYEQGKTLTHLVGTYLGLKELWNESTRCADDYVKDTPIHNAPNYEEVRYRHLSTCLDHPVEMTMNFMDNTIDEDLYMFTEGQRFRLMAMLSEKGPRYGLTQTQTACENLKIKNRQLAGLIQSDNQYQLDKIVRVYPNPAVSELMVELKSGGDNSKGNIVVYNNLGAIIYQQKIEFNAFHQQLIDCTRWTSGVYFIHAMIDDQAFTQKVAISKN